MTATKADIERKIDGKELPFYTAMDAVTFGTGMVAATKEAEELKQQTQVMGMPGVMNYGNLEALDLTEMRDLVYGESADANNTDDTMPQITEDSRDVSPAKNQNHAEDIHISAGTEPAQHKKKDVREINPKQRDANQKVRGEMEIKEPAKASKTEENTRDDELGGQQKTDPGQRKPTMKKDGIQKENGLKEKLPQQKEKNGLQKETAANQKQVVGMKEQSKIQSRTTDVIHKDSDPKIGREVVAKTKAKASPAPEKGQEKGMKAPLGMAARLEGAKEAARASNMMQSIANITQATSRSIIVRDGNNIFATEKEGDQTFAYLNGKKIGAQEATKFFEKMNASQGPHKTMQMENMIKQVAHNPAIQTKNIAEGLAKAQEAKQEERHTRTHDKLNR